MMADYLTTPNLDIAPAYDFFSDIPEVKRDFQHLAKEKTLKKKGFLFLAGDHRNSTYYLTEGRMIASLICKSGKEFIIDVIKPGWLIIAKGSLSFVNFQALTKCRLLEVGLSDWQNLYAIHPELFQKYIAKNRNVIAYLLNLYLSACVDDAETRLKKLLAHIYGEQLTSYPADISTRLIRIDLPQDQLASSIAVSRVMVNRILHRMQSKGLVKIDAHKVYLVNPSQLLNYLEYPSI